MLTIYRKTDRIIPLLEEAEKKGLGILKIHSHPTGYSKFSTTDDISDKELFESVFGWCNHDGIHSSSIMLPSGEIFGRIFTPNLDTFPLDKISILLFIFCQSILSLKIEFF